ncbi:MAG TPA: ribosome biogenesis factor YjgA [Solimonas sp.]
MAKTPALEFEFDGPSKSQLKREAQELLTIGNDLLALPDAQLDVIDMDERLRDGLRVWRKITSHEARRRQGQYIGKILRESDPDALRVEIAAYWRARERAQLDAERWRDRLLADDAAITEWVAAHPGIEVQPLRTLIRNARRERAVLEAAAAENPEAGPAKNTSPYFRDLLLLVRKTLQDAAHD